MDVPDLYRISFGFDGGAGEGRCTEPQSEQLVEEIKNILLTLIVLAMLAALVIVVEGSAGGLAAPALPSIIAAVGVSALAFEATGGVVILYQFLD